MISYGYYDALHPTRIAYFQLSLAHKIVKNTDKSRKNIDGRLNIRDYASNAIKRAKQVIVLEGILTPDEITDFNTKLEDTLKRFPEAKIR